MPHITNIFHWLFAMVALFYVANTVQAHYFDSSCMTSSSISSTQLPLNCSLLSTANGKVDMTIEHFNACFRRREESIPPEKLFHENIACASIFAGDLGVLLFYIALLLCLWAYKNNQERLLNDKKQPDEKKETLTIDTKTMRPEILEALDSQTALAIQTAYETGVRAQHEHTLAQWRAEREANLRAPPERFQPNSAWYSRESMEEDADNAEEMYVTHLEDTASETANNDDTHTIHTYDSEEEVEAAYAAEEARKIEIERLLGQGMHEAKLKATLPEHSLPHPTRCNGNQNHVSHSISFDGIPNISQFPSPPITFTQHTATTRISPVQCPAAEHTVSNARDLDQKTGSNEFHGSEEEDSEDNSKESNNDDVSVISAI